MKSSGTIVVALLGLAAGVFGGAVANTPDLGSRFPVKITSVYDGDTVVVEWTRTARVRLIDCWADEIRTTDVAAKKRGLAARDHLVKLAEGKEAVLFVPYHQNVGEQTTLGRVLGKLSVNGVDLSDAMVASGHAFREKPE